MQHNPLPISPDRLSPENTSPTPPHYPDGKKRDRFCHLYIHGCISVVSSRFSINIVRAYTAMCTVSVPLCARRTRTMFMAMVALYLDSITIIVLKLWVSRSCRIILSFSLNPLKSLKFCFFTMHKLNFFYSNDPPFQNPPEQQRVYRGVPKIICCPIFFILFAWGFI